MASGVEELLDMLFDMVDEAKNVPLSSDKCMIERDRALDLIDDIRARCRAEGDGSNGTHVVIAVLRRMLHF